MDNASYQMESGAADASSAGSAGSAVRHQAYGAFDSDQHEHDSLLPSTPGTRSTSGNGQRRRPPGVGVYRMNTGRRVLLGGMVAAAMVSLVYIGQDMAAVRVGSGSSGASVDAPATDSFDLFFNTTGLQVGDQHTPACGTPRRAASQNVSPLRHTSDAAWPPPPIARPCLLLSCSRLPAPSHPRKLPRLLTRCLRLTDFAVLARARTLLYLAG